MSRLPPSWLPPLRAEARFAWRVVGRHAWTRAAVAWGISLAALARILGEVPAAGGGWRAAVALAAVVGVAVGCRVVAPGPARAALRWSSGRRWVVATGRGVALTGLLGAVATALTLLLAGAAPPAGFLHVVAAGTAVSAAVAAPAAALSARVGSTLAATLGLGLVVLGYAAAPVRAAVRIRIGAVPPAGIDGATALLLVALLVGLVFVLGRQRRETGR